MLAGQGMGRWGGRATMLKSVRGRLAQQRVEGPHAFAPGTPPLWPRPWDKKPPEGKQGGESRAQSVILHIHCLMNSSQQPREGGDAFPVVPMRRLRFRGSGNSLKVTLALGGGVGTRTQVSKAKAWALSFLSRVSVKSGWTPSISELGRSSELPSSLSEWMGKLRPTAGRQVSPLASGLLSVIRDTEATQLSGARL